MTVSGTKSGGSEIMSKTIDYYYALASPFTFLGHERLIDIGRRHGARINFKPVDLAGIFKACGGLPLKQRSKQRLDYRLGELARWKRRLNSDINIEPAFFPVDDTAAKRCVIAADMLGADPAPLSLWYHRAIWVEDKDIADEAVVREGLKAIGLSADDVVARAGGRDVEDRMRDYTSQAVALGALGAPTYVVADHMFWGQDRLDFVDEALG